jgi:hypothetical protein
MCVQVVCLWLSYHIKKVNITDSSARFPAASFAAEATPKEMEISFYIKTKC